MKTHLTLIALFSLASLALAEPRTWTATDGRTVEAEYAGVNGTGKNQRVILDIAGRGKVPFPISGLSQADQDWIAEKLKETKPEEPMKPITSSGGEAGSTKDFIGKWEGYMANSDGSPQGRMNLEITEDRITATNPQGQMMGAGTYTLRGGERVMRIDTEGTDGQYAGRNYEGIVTIEGKTMKWCSTNDNPSARRPTEMQTDMQRNHFLMVMEKK